MDKTLACVNQEESLQSHGNYEVDNLLTEVNETPNQSQKKISDVRPVILNIFLQSKHLSKCPITRLNYLDFK